MTSTIQDYFDIPQERLGVLIDMDFKRIYNIERQIEKEWINKEKCPCVKKLKKGRVLDCEHISQEIDKKTKEIREKLKIKNCVSLYRGLLLLNPQSSQNNSC